MTLNQVRSSAEKSFREDGVYCLSVFVSGEMDADAIAHTLRDADPEARGLLPHARMQTSTVGRIDAAGFKLISSEPPPLHHDLVLPNPPADNDYEAVMAAFDDPRPNPVARSF